MRARGKKAGHTRGPIPNTEPPPPPPTLNPPVWSPVPPLTLDRINGVPDTADITSFASSPDGLTLSFEKNILPTTALGGGVTFDATDKRYEFSGSDPGADVISDGQVLWADDGRSDTVSTFSVTSSVGGVQPFYLAYEFQEGDLRAGLAPVLSIPDCQADIKNWWPDGSVKIAHLCGHATFAAGVAKLIGIKPGTYANIPPVPESRLASLAPNVTFAFSGFPTIALTSLIGQTSTGRGVRGRRETWRSGAEMSEFVYYSPVGTDAHLALWVSVKIFKSGKIHIFPWIENGWRNVASPGQRDYTLTISNNGTTVYTGAINHYHHTRWPKPFWYSTQDPGLTIDQERSYIKGTGLVPDYRMENGHSLHSSHLTSAVQTNNTPFAQGNFPDTMGAGGYDPTIGLLVHNNACHLISGDSRAYNGTIINAGLFGRYCLHYRDETTMRPFRPLSYPTMTIHDTASGVSGNPGNGANTPAPTGGINATYTVSHAPNEACYAYLLTGDIFYLEEVLFHAGLTCVVMPVASRQSQYIFNNVQNRAVAWGMRNVACAAVICPDDTSTAASPVSWKNMQDEFTTILANNVVFRNNWRQTGVTANNLGVLSITPSPTDLFNAGDGKWNEPSWQLDFIVAVVGWTYRFKLPMNATQRAAHLALKTFGYQHVTGRLGGQGTPSNPEYCWRVGAQYTLPYGTPEVNPPTDWYDSWGEAYLAEFGPNTCNSGNTIDSNAGSGAFHGYWGPLLTALAFAVDDGAAGALIGLNKLYNADNWAANVIYLGSDVNGAPVWSVRPRGL